MKNYIDISPDVLKAIKQRKPIVALESTIIAHGMPYPQNVKMALKVEEIIKNKGVTPATIAIIKGRIKVGLTVEEIEFLAKEKNVLKISKRDFGYAISKGLNGATTVSGTMIVAQLVGIKVFATGGIGGVHRGAELSFDISRDLEELSELDVAVVCAGAKSILDLGLTLEYLETKGVEIIGYQTKELPAFYSRESGFKLEIQLDTPTEIASLMKAKWNLGIKGGMVIANPIPKAFNQDTEKMKKIIDEALKEAKDLDIKGKNVTPFLLAKVKDLTAGQSLNANLELVYNNAKLAALIAFEYAK